MTMRVLLRAALIAAITAFTIPAAAQMRAIDGDTLKNERNESVRIQGIDTPELHGRCPHEIERAHAARERLQSYIDAGVTIEYARDRDGEIRRDRYGRLLGRVLTAEGHNVATLMIRDNFGRAYTGRGQRQGWC